jgi:hypothetical protein
MILKWLDTKGVDELAASMARDLAQRVPPDKVDATSRKGKAKREKTHDIVLRQAREYALTNKLNVYTKARLANGFKWKLLEAGYPKDFVDQMTYELAAVVGSARSKRA